MECKPLNGMPMEALEERLIAARTHILDTVHTALDEAMAGFIMPHHRVALAQETAKFVCFMAAIKAAECVAPAGASLDHRDALKQWWPLGRQISKEVPPMLLEFGREAEAQRVQGTGTEE